MSGYARDLEMAGRIAELAAEQGGRAWFVGGYVRDALWGRENKDIDMEVHGLTPGQLESVLDSLGQRLSMGESFGIYALRGYGIDIAMPRKETVRGSGHRDFDVFVDPCLGTEKAAVRRDFTVNAMMQDILTGEVVDHFGGREDLERRVLRHVNDRSFAEDPLRVLRGAQFAARFAMTVAPETVELCRGMKLDSLPRERIEGELKKALLKADRPSIFFEVLRQMDQLHHWFPELEALIGVEQNPRFHAEGDVWTHTMLVLDAAAGQRHKVREPYALMLAALTHDFGKVVCTERIDGVIHAYGHETHGLPLVQRFLNRLTGEKRLTDHVLKLVEFHMKPNTMAAVGASVKSTNRLFDSVPEPGALICLAEADYQGQRIEGPSQSQEPFLQERLAVYKQTMARPYVMGQDLIAAGLTPGKEFSELLAYAHKLRLAGVDKAAALKQTLAQARKQKK